MNVETNWLSQGQGRDKIKLMVTGILKEETRLLSSSYMYMTCSDTLPCWAGYFVNRFEQISGDEDPWMSLLCSGAVCQNGVLHPPSASVCREDSNLLMRPEAPLAQWQNLCWQQCFELCWWPACVLERCQITKSATVCFVFPFFPFLFLVKSSGLCAQNDTKYSSIKLLRTIVIRKWQNLNLLLFVLLNFKLFVSVLCL